jgi:ribosome-binding factor A
LRVGELVRHALADILARGEINDDDLGGLVITVPEVRMSPDLKIAQVYVMPLGGEREDEIVPLLARHARFLRGEVTRRVALKFSPQLRFALDTTFAEAGRIDRLLREAGRSGDAERPRPDVAPDTASDIAPDIAPGGAPAGPRQR